MMLKRKVAVIYGAGGAVARAFAHEGAKLFLTGRHRAPVEAVAKEGAARVSLVIGTPPKSSVHRLLGGTHSRLSRARKKDA